MSRSWSAFRAVRETILIEEVARLHGLRLRRENKELRGLCPFHKEKTASFGLSPEKGVYHCFGCGAKGDAITLHQKLGGFAEPWEAMVDLSMRFGVELPERPSKWHAWQKTKNDIRDAAEETRKVVRRERLFKLLVLSGPEFNIENDEERRVSIQKAWEAWEAGMRRIGL